MLQVEKKENKGFKSFVINFDTKISVDDTQTLKELYKSAPRAYYTLDFKNLRVLNSHDIGELMRFYHHAHEHCIIKIINCNKLVLHSLYISSAYRIIHIPQLVSDSLDFEKSLNVLKT